MKMYFKNIEFTLKLTSIVMGFKFNLMGKQKTLHNNRKSCTIKAKVVVHILAGKKTIV